MYIKLEHNPKFCKNMTFNERKVQVGSMACRRCEYFKRQLRNKIECKFVKAITK